MQAAIAQFLRFLTVERNAAELTVKSYREDLLALDEYLGQAYQRSADPAEITPLDLRGYVSAMHEAGYGPSSSSPNGKGLPAAILPSRFGILAPTASSPTFSRARRSASC
jgi:hypothetical protein